MDIQTEKLSLINLLVNVNDANLIRQIKDTIISYSESRKDKIIPLSLSEFYRKIEESERAYDKGKTLLHDDLTIFDTRQNPEIIKESVR